MEKWDQKKKMTKEKQDTFIMGENQCFITHLSYNKSNLVMTTSPGLSEHNLEFPVFRKGPDLLQCSLWWSRLVGGSGYNFQTFPQIS